MKSLLLAGFLLIAAVPRIVHAECVSDEDCSKDLICINGRCVDAQKCSKDADCPEDHVCRERICKPLENANDSDSEQQEGKDDSVEDEPPEVSDRPSSRRDHRRRTEERDRRRRSYRRYYRPRPEYAHPEPVIGRTGPELSWYDRFYFVFGASVLMHGWGEMGGDVFEGDISEEERGGIYLGLYKASSPYFHFGGFFTYNKGDSKVKIPDQDEWTDETTYYTYKFRTELIAAGLSAKIGAPYSQRVWIGGAFDLGYAKPFTEYWNVDATWHGLYLAGRFNMDILGFQMNGVKVGLSLGLGFEAVPFSKGKFIAYPHHHDEDEEIKSDLWTVRLQLLLALVIGT